MIEILEIQPEYDEDVGNIIRKVGAEFGAIGEGFGPSDHEVTAMSKYYDSSNGSRYLIALVDGKLVGGCGISGFNNSSETCELRKLFLLSESRGLGLGKQLTELCLAFAVEYGYRRCYLDTLSTMTSAIALYEKVGFIHLQEPLEGTIHNGCNVWMLKSFS